MFVRLDVNVCVLGGRSCMCVRVGVHVNVLAWAFMYVC